MGIDPPVLSTLGESVVLQAEITESLRRMVSDLIAFLPRLIGAVIILLIGWILGRVVAGVVTRIVDAVELDQAVLDTPLGRILGGTERAVSRAFGKLAKWFVYAVAILTAADVLAIELLSEWVGRAVTYLPAFIAGLVIIVIGFVVADFVADAMRRTRAATETAYVEWFATGARLFLYFMVLVIGLDTMGVDVGILFVFARAMAWGLAIAIGIGVGVALGWGGKDYVNDNIDRWMGRASSVSPQGGGGGPGGGSTGGGTTGTGGSTGGGTTGGGTDTDVGTDRDTDTGTDRETGTDRDTDVDTDREPEEDR